MKYSKKIGKECNISLLKGVRYENFQSQNNISKIIAKEFLKSKKKIVSSCLICNSKKRRVVANVFKIYFYQCQKCSHVYNKFKYDENFLSSFWKKKGNVINVHSHNIQQKYRPKNLSSPKVKYVKKHLANTRGKNWLDLGCGNGEFLTEVKKAGFNSYGFDLNERDTLLARKKKLKVYKKDMSGFCEIAKREDIKIDVASATGYFDMVSDPNKEFSLLNNIMKKGGIVMIDLPNFNSICHEIIKLYPENSIRHLNATQRSAFTFKSLNMFCKKNGFKIISRWVYGLDFYMLMNFLTLNNKNFQNSKAMSLMISKFSKFQEIIDQEELSDTLFILAKKIK